MLDDNHSDSASCSSTPYVSFDERIVRSGSDNENENPHHHHYPKHNSKSNNDDDNDNATTNKFGGQDHIANDLAVGIRSKQKKNYTRNDSLILRLAVCPEEELMTPTAATTTTTSSEPLLLAHPYPRIATTRRFPTLLGVRGKFHEREEREEQCTLESLYQQQQRPQTSLFDRSLSEDDYLRNAIPWESLEQRAYVDTLLERRAHYKSLRFLGAISLLLVVIVGWVGWFLEQHDYFYGEEYYNTVSNTNQESSGTTTTSTTGTEDYSSPSWHLASSIARWMILVILCMAPLWISYEGRTQETLVDQEIRCLAKKRMLLIPSPNASISSHSAAGASFTRTTLYSSPTAAAAAAAAVATTTTTYSSMATTTTPTTTTLSTIKNQ